MIFEKQIINAYREMAYSRCDDNGTAFYFSADNFSGLKKESYSFVSSLGHQLQGYIYAYESVIPGRIVVFDHGFGGGHRSYMKEIEMLARHGYLVFAYDHTGCMESGGNSPNGMAQSLCDLNDCINAIKKDERFFGLDISVVGHSWGGFSTLNIAALHPEISHIVVLSGFVSVSLLIDSYFPGIMKGYRKPIMELERQANPYFSEFDARESLASTDAKVLLIYSDNDVMCKRMHYDLLKESLADKPNISFKLASSKGHNPNYTESAVKYLGEYISTKTKLLRKKKLVSEKQKSDFCASYDWDKMTEQDEDVWNDIFACLDE